MRAGCGDLQSDAFGRRDEFAASAVHLGAQFADVLADLRSGLDDRLMHLVFHLLDDVGRGGRDELQHVRTQFACSGINDLEFFFDADCEAVSHRTALRFALGLTGTKRRYHTPLKLKLHQADVVRASARRLQALGVLRDYRDRNGVRLDDALQRDRILPGEQILGDRYGVYPWLVEIVEFRD